MAIFRSHFQDLRMRSLLRLPRRAFIGGLRYGEGRLYTKNAGDALR
jgi:hypothetical protein